MKYLIILTLLLLNPVAYADGHCYDFPDDADCKESTEVVDLLDLFTGGSKTDSSKYPEVMLYGGLTTIFSPISKPNKTLFTLTNLLTQAQKS